MPAVMTHCLKGKVAAACVPRRPTHGGKTVDWSYPHPVDTW